MSLCGVLSGRWPDFDVFAFLVVILDGLKTKVLWVGGYLVSVGYMMTADSGIEVELMGCILR